MTKEPRFLTIKWDLLLSMWFIVFFLFAMFQTVSPLLPQIIEDLGITFWLGGVLYSIPLLAIVGLSYPLGSISDKIGVEKAMIIGMFVATLFTFLRGFSHSIMVLAFSTILYGMGLTFCFVSLPKFVKKYFSLSFLTIATGVYTSAISFGAGTGISATIPLARAFNLNWQGVFRMWSISAFLVLLIWSVLLIRYKRKECPVVPPQSGFDNKENNLQQGSATELTFLTGLQGRMKIVFIGGVLLFLLNLFFYCLSGWLPTYLVEKNWEPEIAALAASTIPYVEVPVILILPLFSRNRIKLFTISGFIGVALSVFLIIISPIFTWPACFMLGVSIGAVFPLLLSLPARVPNIGDDIGRASGILLSVGYLGPLVGVPLLGLIRDKLGEFLPGFILLILLSILAAILSLRLSKFMETV